jgi:hypothetical protein
MGTLTMIPPIGERVLWTGGDLCSLRNFLDESSTLRDKEVNQNSRRLAVGVIERLQVLRHGHPAVAFSNEEVTAIKELTTALRSNEFWSVDHDRRFALAAVAGRILLGLWEAEAHSR